MNLSVPGFPVLHCLPELAQTNVHWVGDVHPLLPPSAALNLSQNQGLFQWVSCSHQVARALELQHQSFQWTQFHWIPINLIQSWFPLALTVWSPCSPRDSQESSPALQFESINSLALSLLYGPTLTSIHDYWKNHSFDYIDLCRQKWCLCFLICCLGLSYLSFQGASVF